MGRLSVSGVCCVVGRLYVLFETFAMFSTLPVHRVARWRLMDEASSEWTCAARQVWQVLPVGREEEVGPVRMAGLIGGGVGGVVCGV